MPKGDDVLVVYFIMGGSRHEYLGCNNSNSRYVVMKRTIRWYGSLAISHYFTASEILKYVVKY